MCAVSQTSLRLSRLTETNGRVQLVLSKLPLGHCLGRDHDMRLRAIAALRDLRVAQCDYDRAGAVQRELLECQILRLGNDHPETRAARASLAMILFESIARDSNREV